MKKVKVDGIGIAQEILNKLKPREQENLLKALRERDVLLAEKLDDGRLTMEDLKYLTPEMLALVTQKIDIEDLGLSLRIGSESLRNYILENVSSGTKKDILEILTGPPRAVSDIDNSSQRILKIVKNLIEKGDLYINKDDDDPLI